MNDSWIQPGYQMTDSDVLEAVRVLFDTKGTDAKVYATLTFTLFPAGRLDVPQLAPVASHHCTVTVIPEAPGRVFAWA